LAAGLLISDQMTALRRHEVRGETSQTGVAS
jgi:hypothetical protein